jgi:hypothetical protein
MYRVICPDGHDVALAETFQGILRAVKGGRRGRYRVVELAADPVPPGIAAREWGVVVKFPSGDISIHRRPGPA